MLIFCRNKYLNLHQLKKKLYCVKVRHRLKQEGTSNSRFLHGTTKEQFIIQLMSLIIVMMDYLFYQF
jgi:hypothetical protein